MNRTRGAMTTLTHPDVQTVRSSRRKYIPRSSQRNSNRQHTAAAGASSPRVYSSAPSGTRRRPAAWNTLLSPESKSFKTHSPPRWLPLTAPASASPLQTSRRVNIISTAGSRPVPVRRHPLCAHIPRSAAEPVGPLSPQTGLNCDSNAGGFRSTERGLPSLL